MVFDLSRVIKRLLSLALEKIDFRKEEENKVGKNGKGNGKRGR